MISEKYENGPKPKFLNLGTVEFSDQIKKAIADEKLMKASMDEILKKFQSCKWGATEKEQVIKNENAIKHKGDVIAVYSSVCGYIVVQSGKSRTYTMVTFKREKKISKASI